MGARWFALPAFRASLSLRRRTRTWLFKHSRNHSASSVSTVYLWLILLLFLLVVRDRVLAVLRRPPIIPGLSASELPDPRGDTSFPAAYFGVGAKFVFYTSSYGQFNNQVVSLINALFIARRTDAALVLPYSKLGKESSWDLERAGLLDELEINRELVGDYFNYTHLLSREHVVRPAQFFASSDAADLFARRNITVNYRSGNPFRKLFAEPAARYTREHGTKFRVLSPPHERTPIINYCDFDPAVALASVAERGRNGRFTFLPIVFRKHNLNCTFEEEDWVSIRRGLVPRDEYLHAVDSFMATLPRPILATHLRFFLNGDVGNFTARSLVDMMFRDYGTELMRARTLFLAYSPSSNESREAFDMLKLRYHGTVVDGSKIPSFFREEDRSFASLGLTNVLLDMWTCVKSDMFLGRLGSSLSWNTVYWRQALREEYDLLPENVDRPLWYILGNFTDRNANRTEGPLLGANLRHPSE